MKNTIENRLEYIDRVMKTIYEYKTISYNDLLDKIENPTGLDQFKVPIKLLYDPFSDLDNALEYLIKNEYIYYYPNDKSFPTEHLYKLTFKGIIKQAEGGYYTSYKIKNEMLWYQKIHQGLSPLFALIAICISVYTCSQNLKKQNSPCLKSFNSGCLAKTKAADTTMAIPTQIDTSKKQR